MTRAPLRKVNHSGHKLVSAFAGATTLAAMLVVMVARLMPKIARIVVHCPPIIPRRRIGSDITLPKITSVEEVTARPTKVNKLIKIGRPIWPMIWSFWLRAKRVKSGMLSATVAQNPMFAVMAGKKRDQNSDLFRREESESMREKPPAFWYDQ